MCKQFLRKEIAIKNPNKNTAKRVGKGEEQGSGQDGWMEST